MDYAALVSEHGSIKAAARAIGIAESTFRGRLKGAPVAHRVTPRAAPLVATAPIKSRSLEAFRAEFDKGTIVPGKVRAALAALGDGWLFETEFAQAAGVSLNDLGHYRDEFAPHILTAG